jgi:demethylmenaquinone methyltransferase/2-methoxy-6-polyprenyl-1,4-benzoquinol methylase
MGRAGATDHAHAIGAMFDGIARRYDAVNRLMTAGQDVRWRRRAAEALAPLRAGALLDLGCGTGDLALAMKALYPARPIVGFDLSRGMLAVAQTKVLRAGPDAIGLAQGDALRLPFADGAFSGAASAFVVRNVADLQACLREVGRVLAPGAVFALLEITRPRGGPSGSLFGLYFKRVVPVIGAAVSGRPTAYRYLPRSVDRFLTADELAGAMRVAGFLDVRVHRFFPGPVALLLGRRPVAER